MTMLPIQASKDRARGRAAYDHRKYLSGRSLPALTMPPSTFSEDLSDGMTGAEV
jgi:hypothetical protein